MVDLKLFMELEVLSALRVTGVAAVLCQELVYVDHDPLEQGDKEKLTSDLSDLCWLL